MTADALFRRMAVQLAEQFGKDVVLRRQVSDFDETTGTNTTTDYDVPARAAPPQDFTTDNIENTLIQQGDMVVDVPAKGLDMTSTGAPGSYEPQPSDRLVMDGSTWGIVSVGRAYGGAEVAYFRLQVRK